MEDVGADTAGKLVVAVTSEEPVVAVASLQDIVAAIRREAIIAVAADETVDRIVALKDVVERVADAHSAEGADQREVLDVGTQRIAVGRLDDVVPFTSALDHDIVR